MWSFGSLQQLAICMQQTPDTTETAMRESTLTPQDGHVLQILHKTMLWTCWPMRCNPTKCGFGTVLRSTNNTSSFVVQIVEGVLLYLHCMRDFIQIYSFCLHLVWQPFLCFGAALPINSALLMMKKTAMVELSHALPVQYSPSVHNQIDSPIQYAFHNSKSRLSAALHCWHYLQQYHLAWTPRCQRR